MIRALISFLGIVLVGGAAEHAFMPGEGPVASLALHPPPAAPLGTPRLDDLPPPETSPRLLVPFAASPSSAVARERVLREPRSAAAWASLADANYREGRYEAAWAAARQLRIAAAALDLPLSIPAADLYEKCRRASDALALTE